jgi:exosortase E/protease (VPEID-CTERM system)
VFEGGGTYSKPFWIGAWIVALLIWLALGLAIAIPISFWPRILEKAPRVFGISIVVTAAAMFAGYAAEALWRPLAASTFWMVERVLSLFYADVVTRSDDLVIGTSRFSVEIAPTCSGLEGIGLIVVFLGVFLWCFRHELRFPHALLLLPTAVLTIWIANALRIAALVALGSSWSREVAVGGFHSQTGWIAFNAVALAFVAAAWRCRWFRSSPPASNAVSCSVNNPTAPYLVPLLSLIATSMITAAFSSGFDHLYGARVIVTGAVICFYLQEYRRQGLMHWEWSAIPFAIGVTVFGIWMAAEPFLGADAAAHSNMNAAVTSWSAPEAYTWMIFRAIGSICIIPIVEELAFRGYLARRLISADFQSVPLTQFSWFALLGSSVVFGLMHGRWLAGTVAGALFALAMYRRGRLMDAIVAHVTANALITGYVLATGEWAVWS